MHHKVFSLIKVHQNTHNSVKYEILWKCRVSHSNIKFLLFLYSILDISGGAERVSEDDIWKRGRWGHPRNFILILSCFVCPIKMMSATHLLHLLHFKILSRCRVCSQALWYRWWEPFYRGPGGSFLWWPLGDSQPQ